MKYSGDFRDLFQMAARLKEPDAAHDHIADGKFAIEELYKRDTAGDDITPRFVAKSLRAQLGRGRFESLLFNQADRLIGPVGRFPRFAQKPGHSHDYVRKTA